MELQTWCHDKSNAHIQPPHVAVVLASAEYLAKVLYLVFLHHLQVYQGPGRSKTLSSRSSSGGMFAVRNAVLISTEHHVTSVPQNADSIHFNNGSSKVFAAVDSFCPPNFRIQQVLTCISLSVLGGGEDRGKGTGGHPLLEPREG
eukprot:1033795-Amphidinium_carterae.1